MNSAFILAESGDMIFMHSLTSKPQCW